MVIDKKIIQEHFEPKHLPEWKCPDCKSGVLAVPDKGLKTYEYPSSLKLHDDKAWEPDWIRGSFLGILHYSNAKCKGKTVFAGDMFVEETFGDEIKEAPYYYNVKAEFITPKYFNPPLEIIPFPNDLPEKVFDGLQESFKVFWSDSSSCANKIRITVEQIMDDQKIPLTRWNAKKTKRIRYNLHERIVLFQKDNVDVGELLIAVKWIGNEGSHELNTLNRSDLIVAYEILAQCLDKIYNKIPADLVKAAKKINRRKGIKRK
jgi:hypothetical protein